MDTSVWAFKLGGEIPPGPEMQPSTGQTDEYQFLKGPVTDTDEVETTYLQRTAQIPGARYFIDEYTFNPYRARVKVGSRVMFVNNGNMRHEILAKDGSWGTGPLSPTQQAWVEFDKPGEYTYICKDHPWSYGQIIVENNETPSRTRNLTDKAMSFTEQVASGRNIFNTHRSACHGESAIGRGTAPALLDGTFMSRWNNRTLRDLLEKIEATMPPANPGLLDKAAYVDILAYILAANRVDFGGDEITSEALRQRIDTHK
jgi:plastocyanin/mono/diheme cytochrome c family protein